METRIYKQNCKDCEMNYYVEDLKVIGASRCPKCNGKGMHISEHKIKPERCCDDAIDALMYALPSWIPPHVKKEKTLLIIELQDETSAPKVFYKGEEVKLKQEVEFHWETDTDEYGGLSYAIEHAVEGKSHPTKNRIERRVRGHALI